MIEILGDELGAAQALIAELESNCAAYRTIAVEAVARIYELSEANRRREERYLRLLHECRSLRASIMRHTEIAA